MRTHLGVASFWDSVNFNSDSGSITSKTCGDDMVALHDVMLLRANKHSFDDLVPMTMTKLLNFSDDDAPSTCLRRIIVEIFENVKNTRLK